MHACYLKGKDMSRKDQVHEHSRIIVSLAQVIREGIAKHGGYEINTEGDAFHIAFKNVVESVAFCMEVQYRCCIRTLITLNPQTLSPTRQSRHAVLLRATS